VVINVWGSWCAPCIAEAPRLAEAANRYRGRVQFVGVDILDQPAPARSFIRRYGWSYPSVFDPRAAIRDGMGLLGQPVTILLDASGRRVHLWSGAVPLDQLQQEIDRTLGG
jgi:thiol-disulfide isomerase/thioredoxin